MDRPITAVIAEYNPFHNGHKYQLEQIKSSGSAAVVIMSGAFVQRGAVAVCSKWTRTRTALENGADLVLELPVCYALSSAQRFAEGAVRTLDLSGAVDYLCFGSECGDISALTEYAAASVNEPPEVSERIRALMSSGKTYARAREAAYSGIVKTPSEPNDILGAEYISALMRINSRIVPTTIPRIGTGHHDDFENAGFASASYIREHINDRAAIAHLIPYDPDLLNPLYDFTRLDTAIIAKLRLMSATDFDGICDIGEGLENKILSAAGRASSFDELCGIVKSKRYTHSRIRRAVLCAFLGIRKELSDSAPTYIRVLGANRVGFEILSEMKKKSAIPIITKAADFDRENPSFKLDTAAADIAALCCIDEKQRCAGSDFTTSPIIIDG